MRRAGAAKAYCGACCTKVVKLGVSIGGHILLEDINLHLHCGQLTAVVGPNGAGKTTLLKAVLGEVPYTGHVHFLDSGRQRRDRPLIGYVPQRLDYDSTAPLSVMDLFTCSGSRWPLWLWPRPATARSAIESLAAVQAGHLADKTIGQLSGGELQRVLLALAISPVPDILLLDEPVAGIDAAGTELFYEMVSELRSRYHLSIILVSHDLASVALYADRVVYLNRSVISQGAPAAVLGDLRVRRAFGIGPGVLPKGRRPQPRAEAGHCLDCSLEAGA
jgi:zinc transport system ATP-binding protein